MTQKDVAFAKLITRALDIGYRKGLLAGVCRFPHIPTVRPKVKRFVESLRRNEPEVGPFEMVWDIATKVATHEDRQLRLFDERR